MKCTVIRESLSARLDGEAMPCPASQVDAHLSSCAECTAWLAAAAAVTRRVRVEPAPQVPDLVVPVLAAVAAAGPPRPARGATTRTLLALVALVQLALAAPVLILGHDHTAPIHVAHELGSFDAALAVGLLFSALRPRLAAGMLPLVGAITLLLLATAGFDIAVGRTVLTEETPHLLDLAGFLLLVRVAATAPDRSGVGPPALARS